MLVERSQAGEEPCLGESGVWQGKASTTNDKPVLLPKVKADLFPHCPRYTPCPASPLLHHTFHSSLQFTSSSSNSLGQSSTPSSHGRGPIFCLLSHYTPLQSAPITWPLPILQTHFEVTLHWISCSPFKVQPEPPAHL